MGVGVSLPEGRRILQHECHSTIPHIDAQLAAANSQRPPSPLPRHPLPVPPCHASPSPFSL